MSDYVLCMMMMMSRPI